MLYATTGNKETLYTAFETLGSGVPQEGGFYVPEAFPKFSQGEISGFAMKNPNQAMAEILNLFFGCELNRWDVDFATGRYPVRLAAMVRRITIAEMWHNMDWDFSRTVRDLCGRVRNTNAPDEPGEWGYIAVAIGALFGVFGELMRDGIASFRHQVDIAVPSADLRLAMACRYAREMGLPIGTIILCCNENNNLWNLIRQGQLRTSIPVVATDTALCDKCVPESLERLIHLCGGEEEALRFRNCCYEGRAYFPEDETLRRLQEGMYVSVVSQSRVESTVATVYANHGYIFGPYSALCHGGLMDYRSRTGAGNQALILSHFGALCHDRFTARQLNMAVSALHNIL